ncbi:synemin [Platysternon megacephalum]|uniref:Synemin n=1 Tax=Platysternon megacephalum TaxID=55544 RepID=A0A4D9ERA1_9SAUR|nr:synemin [Platysternon megacephalum]
MAGYVPGLLPANRSQEKEFVQAYEDVLERYKGHSQVHRKRLPMRTGGEEEGWNGSSVKTGQNWIGNPGGYGKRVGYWK